MSYINSASLVLKVRHPANPMHSVCSMYCNHGLILEVIGPWLPSFQIRQPGLLINLHFARAKVVKHTFFSASGGVASNYAYAASTNESLCTKMVPKTIFFASTRLIRFC